jgi:hypothetical protein
MDRLIISALLLLPFSAALAGCTAEGNSYFVGKGEPQRFISLATCEEEARSSHTDGAPKYYAYECRQLLFDRWVLRTVRYENGEFPKK